MAPVLALAGTASRASSLSLRPISSGPSVSATSTPVAPLGQRSQRAIAELPSAAARFVTLNAPVVKLSDVNTASRETLLERQGALSSVVDDEHPWSQHCAAWDNFSASQATFVEPKDHNSVTIKSDTSVKDAAGAVVKVLSRLSSTFVTALRMDASHEALNRAVKALAVARKYVVDSETVSASICPEASVSNEASSDRAVELSFLPMNRSNVSGHEDPNLFAFLAFKSALSPGVALKDHDETDLNVSQGSDPNSMANAIIRIVKERGQAVMKAGGKQALFVAMTAVINARRRLKRNHSMDVMLVPQWITEDTRSTLGRESKFLRFNILPCGLNGVLPHNAAAIVPLEPAELDPCHSYAASVVGMA